MTKLAELKQAIETVRARMKVEGRAALLEAFKEFFSKHPQVRAITWTQYTPYFNDGEPCEFSVHSDFAAVAKDYDGEDEDVGEDEDAIAAIKRVEDTVEHRKNAGKYDWYAKLEELRSLTREEKELIADFDNLTKTISGLEELMKAVLDEGKVVARADGIEVHDYDHD